MAALSDAQRDYFGVFALNGKLLNAMKTNPKEFIKKAKTRGILKILGFKPGKESIDESMESFRYGRVMFMADQVSCLKIV